MTMSAGDENSLHTIRLTLTFFFCELVEKTRLSNTHIPYYDVLKYVGVVVWGRRRRHC